MSNVYPPGVQLAARYRVLRLLESHRAGALFEAEHLATQQRAALKWLRFSAHGASQLAPQHTARAQAATLFRHPHVALVHEVALEGQALLVVSELLQGESLRSRLAPHSMPLHTRLRVLADVMQALSEAHGKGLVHGALHPGNIFLQRDYQTSGLLPAELLPVTAKVLDFGTSTHVLPDSLAFPAEESELGVHAYLNHEQLYAAAPPDSRSDVYACAVLLYQALTGRVPYAAKTPLERAVKSATTEAPAASSLHPGLPASLDTLLHRCLQRERAERPSRLAALVAETRDYAEACAAREVMVGPCAETLAMGRLRVPRPAQPTLSFVAQSVTGGEQEQVTHKLELAQLAALQAELSAQLATQAQELASGALQAKFSAQLANQADQLAVVALPTVRVRSAAGAAASSPRTVERRASVKSEAPVARKPLARQTRVWVSAIAASLLLACIGVGLAIGLAPAESRTVQHPPPRLPGSPRTHLREPDSATAQSDDTRDPSTDRRAALPVVARDALPTDTNLVQTDSPSAQSTKRAGARRWSTRRTHSALHGAASGEPSGDESYLVGKPPTRDEF